ncbi:MAG TPA: diacylglycerol kinase family protein [Ornithinibacter sp.]|nr:diacylglycerol kinase family protein [Ornithinibacter sp.]
MTARPAERTGPDRRRQAAAWLAYLTLAAAAVYLVVVTIRRWDVLLAGLASLAVLVVAAWFAVSRRGTPRVVALVVGAAALVLFVVVMVASESVRVLVVGLLLAAASTACARFALHEPAAGPADASVASRPRQAVLIMNPWSGGGKVERFELERLCRERGIEPIVLVRGSDLLALAEDAVRRGADVIGMAGGDGSQALVASVASRHGIPLVVIPAGTRNHFALDLGLDRADVVGALDAFDDGVDQQIDLAEVNGRVFVNNASMGLYAKIVQSAEYRDAKVQTAAATLPDLIGPAAVPLDLQFTLPSGEPATSANLVLVSNNPYQLSHLRGAALRPRLDTGELGIVSVLVRGAADAEKFAALEAAGQVRRFSGWNEWTDSAFEVTSGGPVEVGVDGEALTLDPPLRFTIRPGALTIRLPRASLSRRRAAPAVHVASTETLSELWHTALGRPAAAAG